MEAEAVKGTKGFAVASLVLGILGVWGLAGVPFALVSLVLASQVNAESEWYGYAKAGKMLSKIGLCLAGVILLVLAFKKFS